MTRRTRRTIAFAAGVAVTAALTLALAASGGNTVQTRKTTVNGKQETILTTSKGMSLYYFDKDSAGTSTCTGRCAKLWPAYTVTSGQPSGPAGVAGGLKAFQGANGRQLEYHGHPLYTYVKDTKPGDLKGVGIFPTWHVATTSLKAGATSSGASGSASGASGYGSGSGSSTGGSSSGGSAGNGSSGSSGGSYGSGY